MTLRAGVRFLSSEGGHQEGSIHVQATLGGVPHGNAPLHTLRGRRKVNAQWQLFTTVHNIEKIAHGDGHPERQGRATEAGLRADPDAHRQTSPCAMKLCDHTARLLDIMSRSGKAAQCIEIDPSHASDKPCGEMSGGFLPSSTWWRWYWLPLWLSARGGSSASRCVARWYCMAFRSWRSHRRRCRSAWARRSRWATRWPEGRAPGDRPCRAAATLFLVPHPSRDRRQRPLHPSRHRLRPQRPRPLPIR